MEPVYFHSVFNELKRLGEWNKPNLLDNIKQIKTTEQEMTTLRPIKLMRYLLNRH
ncbi:phage integrase [Gilliamella sp. Lep-s21]|uniref:phage integrase n=1 Tax=Gilliamella sp. Lep-s21 TaxID=2687309 RepID=UPI003FA56ACC